MYEKEEECLYAIEELNKKGLQASFARMGQVKGQRTRMQCSKTDILGKRRRNRLALVYGAYKMRLPRIYTFQICH